MVGSQLRRIGACLALLIVAACATGPVFEPGVSAEKKPWTSEQFNDASDGFSFAVVADLESGYRKGVFDVAIAQLALMRPAFVTMTADGPSIANLRLDGVLDKTGAIPANGASLCLDFGPPNCPTPSRQ